MRPSNYEKIERNAFRFCIHFLRVPVFEVFVPDKERQQHTASGSPLSTISDKNSANHDSFITFLTTGTF